MLSQLIPAKTFLLGEYIALSGLPALLLTTQPCFQLSLTQDATLHGIHPASPAGRFWLDQALSRQYGLDWQDPYRGIGGLGASSAQFLGAVRLYSQLTENNLDERTILSLYWQYAWSGEGLKPSGYDVLAQMNAGCVYIENYQAQTFAWPFPNLDWTLIHTDNKLATHLHLLQAQLPDNIDELAQICFHGHQAFQNRDEMDFVQAVRAYHQALAKGQRVADHSLQLLGQLEKQPLVLAAKGCGAMGADKILIIHSRENRLPLHQWLQTQHHPIIATADQLQQIG